MLLQKFLSRKKLSRRNLSIFVSKIGPATGVIKTLNRVWSNQNLVFGVSWDLLLPDAS